MLGIANTPTPIIVARPNPINLFRIISSLRPDLAFNGRLAFQLVERAQAPVVTWSDATLPAAVQLRPAFRLMGCNFCVPSPTRLVFLGTGTPNPDPRRLGPCAAVIVDGTPFLVDAGAGCVRQAIAARIEIQNLSRVFLTHLHSDHTIGLPDLFLTPAVTGRERLLEVWGPPGIEQMISHIREAWSEDIGVRLGGGEPSVAEAYGTVVHTIEPGV